MSARAPSGEIAPPSAASAARDSEQRLDLVLWSTGDELGEGDLVRDEYTMRNPLKHFDFPEKEQVRKGSEMRSDLRAEDRPDFDRAFIAHLKGLTEFVDVVYRARTTEGEWRWLRTRGRVTERDAQ